LDRKQALIDNCFEEGRILLAAGDSESDQPMLVAASHRIVIGSSLANEWRGEPNTLALPKGELAQEDVARIQIFLKRLEER